MQVTDPETNETNEHRDFAIAEAIFITWFTIEYFVRGIASPKKWDFIKEGMNVIDLLGIVPYFVSLALSNMKSSGEYQDEIIRFPIPLAAYFCASYGNLFYYYYYSSSNR